MFGFQGMPLQDHCLAEVLYCLSESVSLSPSKPPVRSSMCRGMYTLYGLHDLDSVTSKAAVGAEKMCEVYGCIGWVDPDRTVEYYSTFRWLLVQV